MRLSIYTLLAVLVFGVTSCVKDQVERTTTYYSDEDEQILESAGLILPTDEPADYNVELPTYAGTSFFGQMDRGLATLGRVLFYDDKLSANSEISCASCHLQERAFSDPVAKSAGIVDGVETVRNSYAIGSTASTRQYYDISRPTLFWDSRARTVSQQSEETLANAIEMGMDMEVLVQKLKGVDYYEVLFEKAFGDPSITDTRILRALEEFVLSFNANQTKFDKVYAGKLPSHNFVRDDSGFTSQENKGKALFMSNCAGCHGETFTLAATPQANNGLEMDYEDKGIGELTGSLADNGVFKVPILRNVTKTAPYMHDGRFETLEEVIEFYSSGIQPHNNLHPLLKEEASGEPKRFGFTTDQKQALLAFLKALEDDNFTSDVKWSNPFSN